MSKSTDYLVEHGFIELECYVCHELLILPKERYEKYVAYKHDYCKASRPVNPYWKSSLALIAGMFFPLWTSAPIAIVDYAWLDTGWLRNQVAGGLLFLWAGAALAFVLWSIIDGVIHDQGSM